MSYRPTEVDKQWMLRMIASVSDGGTWGCPAGGSVYIVDKKNKVLRRKVSLGISPEEFERTTAVAKAIGWTTSDEQNRKDNK